MDRAHARKLNEAIFLELQAISEKDLRAQVEELVALCLDTLDAARKLHLPHDQFEIGRDERASDDRYLELAPYMLSSLVATNKLLHYVTDTFEAPPEDADSDPMSDDFDFEFDLVGDEEPQSPTPDTHIEEDRSPRERVAHTAHSYAGMLRLRVGEMADRLALCLQQDDSWPLLAQLDDGKRKLQKGIQGMLFGVLNEFGGHQSREDILPEYRSTLGESIDLRAAVSELSFHIGRFNDAIASADADIATPLMVGVSDRLARFSAKTEYRNMRPDDKRSVIDFRKRLYQVRRDSNGLSMVALRQAVEGFSKFLESLHAINHREVLVLHDKKKLEWAVQQINAIQDSAASDPSGAVIAMMALNQGLEPLVGRSPELDAARHQFFRDPASPETIQDTAARWAGLLQGILATV